jgi:hypothetical protein
MLRDSVPVVRLARELGAKSILVRGHSPRAATPLAFRRSQIVGSVEIVSVLVSRSALRVATQPLGSAGNGRPR